MITVGIDVGGSATKIAAFQEDGRLMSPLFVRATDPVTSVYGALGRFTAENNVRLEDIRSIMVTGAGGAYVGEELYGRPCVHVSEFESVGRGGIERLWSVWVPARRWYMPKAEKKASI